MLVNCVSSVSRELQMNVFLSLQILQGLKTTAFSDSGEVKMSIGLFACLYHTANALRLVKLYFTKYCAVKQLQRVYHLAK